MPSVRAALGLPSALSPLPSPLQQKASQDAAPQSVLNEQTDTGQATGLPIETKGAKSGLPGQQQPVDMQKLLTVSSAVIKLAARSTDAHAMLLKVR